jgi:flagellar biosynthesis chaperone FliJ
MARIVYPLEEVLQIKRRRVEEAEKMLAQKLEALDVEKKKLLACEEARDKVKNHLSDKMRQLRTILDEGTTSPKIEEMRVYIKVVQERLAGEEKKVVEQQKQVEIAEKNVEEARILLKKRRQEVDKLVIHRQDWWKEMNKELEIAEGREQDEMGSVSYMIHKRMGY